MIDWIAEWKGRKTKLEDGTIEITNLKKRGKID